MLSSSWPAGGKGTKLRLRDKGRGAMPGSTIHKKCWPMHGHKNISQAESTWQCLKSLLKNILRRQGKPTKPGSTFVYLSRPPNQRGKTLWSPSVLMVVEMPCRLSIHLPVHLRYTGHAVSDCAIRPVDSGTSQSHLLCLAIAVQFNYEQTVRNRIL